MAATLATLQRVTAAALGAALLLQFPSASGGIFTTESALANFTFAGAVVNYDPDPDEFEQHWSEDVSALNATSFNAPIEATGDSLTGELTITATPLSGSGNLSGNNFNFFGSLPPMDPQTNISLLQGSLGNLNVDNKGLGRLAFLLDQHAINGSLANLYRRLGIYVQVDGIDTESWVKGFSDQADTVQLVSLENAEAGIPQGDVTPVPLPGTLLLLLAGLLPLWFRRRLV